MIMGGEKRYTMVDGQLFMGNLKDHLADVARQHANSYMNMNLQSRVHMYINRMKKIFADLQYEIVVDDGSSEIQVKRRGPMVGPSKTE
jgi:hypothetical protein